MKKILKTKSLIASLLIAAVLFMLTRPVFVSALVQPDTTGNIYETEVREDENGFSQIIIKDTNGKVTFITDDATTHSNPQISDQMVVWMAQVDSRWQIFFYDISIEKTIQLTYKGNNVNPQISGKYIVWEGIRDGNWQILLFDGIKITQLTTGDNPKQDVTIEGNTVAFSQKEGDIWQVYLFDIETQTFTKVSDQSSGRNPTIKQDVVIWGSFNDEGEVVYEYNIKDKKVKKLTTKDEKPKDTPIESIIVPQPVSEPVTEEDIREEIGLEEIVEVVDTPESTPSQDAPSLEDLIDVEDTEESTASGN